MSGHSEKEIVRVAKIFARRDGFRNWKALHARTQAEYRRQARVHLEAN